jgi:uncharacterized protein (TIGR00251 family)
MIDVRAIPGGVRFAVKAVAGASRDQLAGAHGGAVKVRTSQPAERGKANVAITRLLAAALGVKPAAVRIVSGPASPMKLVEVQGITPEEAVRRLMGR